MVRPIGHEMNYDEHDLFGEMIGNFYMDKHAKGNEYITEDRTHGSTHHVDIFKVKTGGITSVLFNDEEQCVISRGLRRDLRKKLAKLAKSGVDVTEVYSRPRVT